MSDDGAERVRRVAIALAAMAQTGLTFTENEYDRHRYTEAGAAGRRAVLGRLRAGRRGPNARARPRLRLRDAQGRRARGDLRRCERVLLMRERSDGRWSLPGGWADPLDTPTAAVVREIREETGYGAEVVSLVGCWDRDTQGHLPRCRSRSTSCSSSAGPWVRRSSRRPWRRWRSAGSPSMTCRALAGPGQPAEIARCLAHHHTSAADRARPTLAAASPQTLGLSLCRQRGNRSWREPCSASTGPAKWPVVDRRATRTSVDGMATIYEFVVEVNTARARSSGPRPASRTSPSTSRHPSSA